MISHQEDQKGDRDLTTTQQMQVLSKRQKKQSQELEFTVDKLHKLIEAGKAKKPKDPPLIPLKQAS